MGEFSPSRMDSHLGHDGLHIKQRGRRPGRRITGGACLSGFEVRNHEGVAKLRSKEGLNENM